MGLNIASMLIHSIRIFGWFLFALASKVWVFLLISQPILVPIMPLHCQLHPASTAIVIVVIVSFVTCSHRLLEAIFQRVWFWLQHLPLLGIHASPTAKQFGLFSGFLGRVDGSTVMVEVTFIFPPCRRGRDAPPASRKPLQLDSILFLPPRVSR
jgi:hypothetical protein